MFIDGDGTGLMHIFAGNCDIKHDEHGDHLLVHTPNGIKKVYYKGAGKANSVGAITGMSLGSVVFCEINLLHLSFIQEAFRRTMAAAMPYHLADLNPPSPMHPVIKQVFEVRDMRWTHWTMDDNPILTTARKNRLIATLKKNPYLYKRDVLGQRVMPDGVIYSMFDMEKNIRNVIEGVPIESFFVGDGGQSDATTMGYYLITKLNDGTYHMYQMATYYHSGRETGQAKAMSVYAKELTAFIRWCFERFNWHYSNVFIDPACKSLREELHLLGVDTTGADNNAHDVKGSSKGIEVGIERTQSAISDGYFYLFEHDAVKYDHYYVLQEIGLYVRDDDSGKAVDDNNHCMDILRYANNYLYRNYILKGR